MVSALQNRVQEEVKVQERHQEFAAAALAQREYSDSSDGEPETTRRRQFLLSEKQRLQRQLEQEKNGRTSTSRSSRQD